jgi:two-component system C4-dicarboxylate transport sensor histidine kinase DctB
MRSRTTDPVLNRSRDARRRLMVSVIVYMLLIAIILLVGNAWARDRAISKAARLSQAGAAGRASLLISELQKYRLIPIVLGEYPDVYAALADPAGAATPRLNDKLEQMASMIGSSAIYLIDANGRTIAASNARLPTSFVGQNYAFRPYFTIAKQHGAAEFFGLGTISGQPGLYLARRVGAPLHRGVIVVKFGFGTVERGWASASEPVFVTDANGVVLITNRPAWRFRTTRALPPALLAELRRTRQFGTAPLAPLPVTSDGAELAQVPRRGGLPDLFTFAAIPVPVSGWTLTAFEPIRPLRADYLATSRLATIAAAILLMIPLFLWLRARERADLAAMARIELEEKVTLRTAELERAQMRFREAREELAHANRLGSIGQITAAVAHEVNQPAAAIRAFAENSRELLRRGNEPGVAANLDAIAGLTTRIGAITAELRTYARRGSGEVRETRLDAAIERALLFAGHRLRSSGIALERSGTSALSVLADPLRLEQVLVNLLHNSIEALDGVADPRILIAVERSGERVAVLVADTGNGIAAEVADTLFTPFITSKPSGLGLGLGIARDIAREFGGELDLAPTEAPWVTGFRLDLRPA